jgi:uncharacterized membrane protein YcaP (DUF421 family)
MEIIEDLLGIDVGKLQNYQMINRAIVIFFTAILLVRISGIRTLGKQTAFDNLTALMLGAIMGRAIVTADQPFFGSILATLVIMVLHRLLSWVTFRSKRLGFVFKGSNIMLMKDGKKLQKNLQRTNITEEDILEASRKDLNACSLDKVREVFLERSGEISFVKG